MKHSTLYFLFSVFCASILLSTFYFLFSGSAFAAELYYDPSEITIDGGSDFSVSVLLNTGEQYINAVGVSVEYPEELLAFKGWTDGGSVVQFFLEKPKAENGWISFQGIIPGGYQGGRGFLLKLGFVAKKSGRGIISFASPTEVFLNDGQGTKATLEVKSFEINVVPEGEAPDSFSDAGILADTDPPERFRPEISKLENVFGGKYFLVFATQDKGSGMDRYEVCEDSRNECVVSESPFLLKNQKLDKKIFVKALDHSGNERMEVIYPQNFLPWYKNYWILGILIIVATLVIKTAWQRFTR